MTNPTSNFGWQMPTSTDLVTDLPADFEVFGQAVDTSLADLKGGTTGQVLKKNTNTDMDFVWGTVAGDIEGVSVTSPITGGGTSGTVTIGIDSTAVVPSQTGNSGKYLTTNGTTSSWATVSVTQKVVQIITASYDVETSSSTGTFIDTGLTATITPTSASNKILVFVSQNGLFKATGNTGVSVRLMRGSTTLGNLFAYGAGGNNTTTNNNVGGASYGFLDSPATTSATIYKTQFCSTDAVATARVQNGTQASSIVLMEVTP
jgi:hypothetical protein